MTSYNPEMEVLLQERNDLRYFLEEKGLIEAFEIWLEAMARDRELAWDIGTEEQA